MGEARLRAKKRRDFLTNHPQCIYCGARATTTDHCPPRCFFERRVWPDTYEFPACEKCNAAARLDEQALAVLFRSRLKESREGDDRLEWERLVRGVRNNQPEVMAEWASMSRNAMKRSFRKFFGEDGDLFRREGWGMAYIGPKTRAMLNRFMVKLAKALYYRHNEAVFDGILYVHHINPIDRDNTPDYLQSILHMAPALPVIRRNNQSLLNQFIYRFNHSAEHGAMYAVVQFGEQFIFQLIAISRNMAQQIEATLLEEKGTLPTVSRFDCRLS